MILEVYDHCCKEWKWFADTNNWFDQSPEQWISNTSHEWKNGVLVFRGKQFLGGQFTIRPAEDSAFEFAVMMAGMEVAK